MASDIEAAGEQNTVDAQEDEDVMPTEVIKARLANFVAVRASRRRHVQLPLFALAGLLLIAGMCIFLAGGAGVALPFSFHWAEVALNASGMVIVLSAMPGDVRLLRSILVAFIAMIGFAAFGEVRPLLIATQGLVGALNGEAPGARERATLWLLMLSPCAKLIACVGSVLGAALLLAGSCIGRVSPLHMTTLCLYLLCVFYLAIAVANAFAAARAAIDPTVGRGPYSQTSRAELISVHVVLVVQGIIFGLTGLFSKRLRSRVHAFLAGRGVGVSAAAGIGELLNGVKAADVLRDASASFRAVSLDDLTYEVLVPAQRVDAPMLRVGQRNLTTGRVSGSSSHTALERLSNSTHADRIGVEPTPASSSGTIARHAELGQVDAFVSHSWHDPPDVKWKALQVGFCRVTQRSRWSISHACPCHAARTHASCALSAAPSRSGVWHSAQSTGDLHFCGSTRYASTSPTLRRSFLRYQCTLQAVRQSSFCTGQPI